MKNRIILFMTSFAIWLLFSWSVSWQHLITGIAVSALVSLLTAGLFKEHQFKFKGVKRYFLFFFKYCPVFLWELVKANLDVAYRVAHPNLPINPGIVKVRTNLKSETALTFLSNSITLTPGTLTVDVDSKNGYLYVHWINVLSPDVEEATAHIVARFEKILREIFE